MLYGVETWWEIDKVIDELLLIERLAIKRCLGVRKNIPNDVIYTEINRPDLHAHIKDLQWNFLKKLQKLKHEDALVKDVMVLCQGTHMMRYYNALSPNNKTRNKQERLQRLSTSDKTMTKRYIELTNGEYNSSIYDWNIPECYRCIITRWRLSCFDLAIETGRHGNSKKTSSREGRTCSHCLVLEDEYHVLFVCVRYADIRRSFIQLINKNPTVRDMLHPSAPEVANEVGRYLKLIEEARSVWCDVSELFYGRFQIFSDFVRYFGHGHM